MSDFDFFSRQGPAVGDANENRLLQKVGGSNTIRKTFQNNADGSTTMLHTRGPGARPEVITNELNKVEPPPLLCPWSLDYNAIKSVDGAFQSDFVTTAFGDTPRFDLSRGPKTRRFGLKKLPGGDYTIKIGVSTYDALDTKTDGKKVRGSHCWYTATEVVTWTRHVAVQSVGGGTEYHAFGTIQYGDNKEIIVVPQTAPSTYNYELFAACLVNDALGNTYVRAALARRDGFGGIQVRDYSDETTYAPYVVSSPTNVGGTNVTKIYPYMLAWSPDGTKLITTFDSSSETGGSKAAQAIVFNVAIPGEAVTITPALHTFAVPMTAAATPADVYFDSNPTNAGAVGVETPGLAHNGQMVSRTTTPPGTTTNYSPPSNGYSIITNFSRKMTRLVSSTATTVASVSHVGFNRNGVICGAVTTYDVTNTVEYTTMDRHLYESTIYSNVYEFNTSSTDGTSTTDTVWRASGRKRRFDTETNETKTDTSALVTRGLYVLEGDATTYGATVSQTSTYRALSSSVFSGEEITTRSGNGPVVTEMPWHWTAVDTDKTSALETEVVTQPVCAMADFFDGTVLVCTQATYTQPEASGTLTVTEDSYPSNPLGLIVTTTTYAAPTPPTSLDATYTLGRLGGLFATKTIPRPLGAYVPAAADWCAKRKSLLMVNDYADGVINGLFYNKGWHNFVRNPNEPTPEHRIGWLLNIGHF